MLAAGAHESDGELPAWRASRHMGGAGSTRLLLVPQLRGRKDRLSDGRLRDGVG